MTMQIRFWGVRGSIPSPGAHTALTGGNTACVELRCGDSVIVLDAGTGIRTLGNALSAIGRPVDVALLLSHMHWDHIQGLPFFSPIYDRSSRIVVMGAGTGGGLRDTLRRQMSYPTFPVLLDDLPAALRFRHLADTFCTTHDEALITAVATHHPGGGLAYRIDHQGSSVVYATDTEPNDKVDLALCELATDADVLIYDAQYTPEEYDGRKGPKRVGWGHSTFEHAAAMAQQARVGRLVLFHHDPQRCDAAVQAIEAQTQRLFPSTRAAHEGMVINLGGVACAA